MTKKPLIPIVLALLLVVGLGAGYKFGLADPSEAAAKPKVKGHSYVLGKEFLVNLSDGRYAQFTVALVLAKGDTSTEAVEGEEGHVAKPLEGYGDMRQESIVRAIISDEITGLDDTQLIRRDSRERVARAIAKQISKRTDVKVDDVLFPDMRVQ